MLPVSAVSRRSVLPHPAIGLWLCPCSTCSVVESGGGLDGGAALSAVQPEDPHPAGRTPQLRGLCLGVVGKSLVIELAVSSRKPPGSGRFACPCSARRGLRGRRQ